MLSEQAIILEKFIQVMLNQKFINSNPREQDLIEIAENLNATIKVSEEELNVVLKRLKANLNVTMDLGVHISLQSEDYQSWLPSRQADIDFFYWDRYKEYLELHKGWNNKVTSKLDVVSSEIVDLLGDPRSNKDWQRRGLVLGDVQSGKTANYTAICNKASDAGYNVIIVLAGMMENLRKQTQERLDKEFAGRLSKDLLLKSKHEIKDTFDGVGLINKNKRIFAFTSTVTDFNARIVSSNDLTLKGITEPALFVVKKNKSILKNLDKWLMTNNADANGKINLSVLVIDDEADNASVNTKSEEDSPTAINAAIRTILSRFNRASYLGVTATPYANIFINPETEDEMIGDDLFPKDFIYVLSPPSNYIGADLIFGDDSKYSDSLIPILKNEMEDYLPIKHKKDYYIDELPPSLYDALNYFLLTNVIRDYHKDNNEHRSMLINVSRFTDIQNEIGERIQIWLNKVQSDIRNYSKLDEEEALKNKSLSKLKDTWFKYKLNEKTSADWKTIQQDYLAKAILPILVRAVNQKTGSSSLDYQNHKETGLRVIAVGGNSLSRGLTLEGLIVSYFYRNSQMYDTLLQMGRWFGYRPNYNDVFKIWMYEDAIEWFGYINAATNELKLEISRMNQQNQTPRDFGLKVRQDPNSLIVTARNKMRSGKTVTRPVNIAGSLLETPRLKKHKKILENNKKLFSDFLSHLKTDQLCDDEKFASKSGLLWLGVEKKFIVELLYQFETHPWHLSFQGNAIAEYIDSSELDLWDVYVAQGSSKKEFKFKTHDGNYKIKPSMRTIDTDNKMIKISGNKVRVGTVGLTKNGLTREQIKIARNRFNSLKEGNENRAMSDSHYLIKERKPILILHVIEPKEPKDVDIPELLFALAVGIPNDGIGTKVANYVVNFTELSNWIDTEETFDEDESDE